MRPTQPSMRLLPHSQIMEINVINLEQERTPLELLREPGLFFAGATSLLTFSYGFGTLTGRSPCPFYNLTGLPCPGCGGTRAFLELCQGNVGVAVADNLYGVVLIITVIFLWLRWIISRLKGIPAPIFKFKAWHGVAFAFISVVWFIFRISSWGTSFVP